MNISVPDWDSNSIDSTQWNNIINGDINRTGQSKEKRNKKRNRNRKRKRIDNVDIKKQIQKIENEIEIETNDSINNIEPPKKSLKTSSISSSSILRNKLKGARFRDLNEKLYTCSSEDGQKIFEKERELFNVYHDGFSESVKNWPVNPVDLFYSQISKGKWKTIADMGCGDASLAKRLQKIKDIKVFSFDFVALNPLVTECDMRSTPLSDSSVDLVVFSLSLMGNNWMEFIKEAHRILKPNGTLKIAEVRSRFPKSDPNYQEFIASLTSLGFSLIKLDPSLSVFTLFDFTKTKRKNSKKNKKKKYILNPCFYKKR